MNLKNLKDEFKRSYLSFLHLVPVYTNPDKFLNRQKLAWFHLGISGTGRIFEPLSRVCKLETFFSQVPNLHS